jgi:hypothetical protein
VSFTPNQRLKKMFASNGLKVTVETKENGNEL